MFLVFLAIIAIVLAITFLLGLIFFIVGLANKKKVKKDKKKWPVVLTILGIITMIPPLIISLIAVAAASKYNYDIEHMLEKYGTVTKAWENVEVGDRKAANQALEVIFAAADKGDRAEFVSNFSQETRDLPGFDEAVDSFFEAYPGGFHGKEYYYNAHGGDRNGKGRKGARHGYECDVDGIHYYISIGYTYFSEDNTNLGINYLTIMNVGGDAVFNDDNSPFDKDSIFLMCYLPDPDEVKARRIDRYTFLWNESDGPVLTADEMRTLLAGYNTLQEVIDDGKLGHPNAVTIKNGFDLGRYYYELKPVNGEPRYAAIHTSGAYGRIIEAFECTDSDADFDNMIVEHRKK